MYSAFQGPVSENNPFKPDNIYTLLHFTAVILAEPVFIKFAVRYSVAIPLKVNIGLFILCQMPVYLFGTHPFREMEKAQRNRYRDVKTFGKPVHGNPYKLVGKVTCFFGQPEFFGTKK